VITPWGAGFKYPYISSRVEPVGKSTVEFISKGLIPLGPKKITRMTNKPGQERYLIYLPLELNDLWREVYESGRKIKVYIEIVS
jgi:hypothetical protein